MFISILGLGYIGLPTAVVLAQNGHRVFGYDINSEVIRKLNTDIIPLYEHGLAEAYKSVIACGSLTVHDHLQEADVYLIAVPTPFATQGNCKKADLSFVQKATSAIAQKLKKRDLVILESTSPPQTMRGVTAQLAVESGLIKGDFHTAYCPERILPGNILYELAHNDRIIGSEDEKSSLLAKELYGTFVKGTIYVTDDITAEMCKLAENSFRDVNIAFANELSILCDQVGISVHSLITLANKHPRVNILNPGIGVGGHCVAVDPYFLIESFQEEAKLIAQAREVNEYKTDWVAQKIEEHLCYDKNTTIGILGLAYKPNIDDLRESPAMKLARHFQESGYTVIACEPYVKGDNVNGISLYPLEILLDKADFSILAVQHDEFIAKMYLLEQANAMIL